MGEFEPEPGHLVADLDTPTILCDLDRLERNITEWQGIMDRNRTRFRSHEGSPGPRDAGHDEGRPLVDIAGKLRAAGVEVREVTAGSSFTGKWVAEVPGVTEARAGTYAFYDLMHLSAGTATEDQLALSALCTVVSHRTLERLTIDGGSKTFSGDGGAVGAVGGPRDLASAAGRRVFVDRLTEEHGMARAEEPVELGEKLRFYPFHACTCANLTDQIVGFRGDRVERVWTVAARGLRT